MQTNFDEKDWPELTAFRRACLANDLEEMRRIGGRRHHWFENENPDAIPMEKLAKVYQAQFYSSENDFNLLGRLIWANPWVVNFPWTAQGWLPITQAVCAHGDPKTIEMLLNAGADPQLEVGDPEECGTAIDMARAGGNRVLANQLKGTVEKRQMIGHLQEEAGRARRAGNPGKARELLEEALPLSAEPGLKPQRVKLLGRLAHIEDDLGNGEEALILRERSLAEARDAPCPIMTAYALRHFADSLIKAGRLPEAMSNYEEALEILQAAEGIPPLDLANTCRSKAILHEEMHEPEASAELWHAALTGYQEAGATTGVEECQDHLKNLVNPR